VLGTYTDELQERFHGLDVSVMEGILKDMQTEDDALKPYVETCQLEKWYQSALDLAKLDFADELDAETDDGQNMREVAQTLEGIESQINEKLKAEADKALRVTKQSVKESRASLDRLRSSTRHL
jgi:nuclear pore complex protein Nup133